MVFRGQQLTPERQIEFSRLFGPLEMHPLKVKTSEDNPELFVLENGGEADAYQTAFFDGEEIVGRLLLVVMLGHDMRFMCVSVARCWAPERRKEKSSS